MRNTHTLAGLVTQVQKRYNNLVRTNLINRSQEPRA